MNGLSSTKRPLVSTDHTSAVKRSKPSNKSVESTSVVLIDDDVMRSDFLIVSMSDTGSQGGYI